jgi:hypothetical protein
MNALSNPEYWNELSGTEFLKDPDIELKRASLSRSKRISRPIVVTLPEPPDKSVQKYLPASLFRSLVPGTIVFFAAPQGSALFKRLLEAAYAHDFETLDLLADRIGLDLFRALTEPPKDDRPVINVFEDVPAFVDLRYKHKLLVRGLFPISTWEVAEASILWTGGELEDEKFVCVEYITSSSAPELETLVLKIPPRLTPVERAIFSQAPVGGSELNLRGSEVAILPAVAIAVTARIIVRAAPLVARATPYVVAGVQEFAKQLGKRAADGIVFVATYLVTQAVGSIPFRSGTPLSADEIESFYERLQAARPEDTDLAISFDQLLDLRQELVNRLTEKERSR